MANDRDDRLRKAEKAVRQGRIDAAIAEYTALVSEQVNDLSSLNALGDLLVRAGRSPDALPFYMRVADAYLREGFYSKAAGFYRKVLKFAPSDEIPALRLAEALAAQGLIVEAKAQFAAIAQGRRRRGDETGLEEVLVRIGEIDPKDVTARLDLARLLAGRGDARAAGLLDAVAEQLRERGQTADALAVVRELLAVDPRNARRRAELAQALLGAGDVDGARALLAPDLIGDDAALVRLAAELMLRTGTPEEAREGLARWLTSDSGAQAELVAFARAVEGLTAERRYVAVEVAVDAAVDGQDFAGAASLLQDFLAMHPGSIPALLRLLDVCVDGDIAGVLEASQAQLAQAYLEAGRHTEARLVAEDLVLREPDRDEYRSLLRRILEALGEAHPDAVIEALFELEAGDDLGEEVASEAPTVVNAWTASPEPAATASDFAAAAGPRRVETPLVVPVQLVPDVIPAHVVPSASEVDLSDALDELTARTASEGEADARDEFEEDEEEAAELEDVFDDMRSRASTTRGVDGRQQLALGRTYLAAGLVDQAVGAFKRAAHDPAVRASASVALGEIFEEQEDYAHAIEWFERGADAAPEASGERLEVMRRLALALEAGNESVRALAVWLEIQALHPEDTEAPTRVARLSSPGAGR